MIRTLYTYERGAAAAGISSIAITLSLITIIALITSILYTTLSFQFSKCEFIQLHFSALNDNGIYFHDHDGSSSYIGIGLNSHQSIDNRNSIDWINDISCHEYDDLSRSMFMFMDKEEQSSTTSVGGSGGGSGGNFAQVKSFLLMHRYMDISALILMMVMMGYILLQFFRDEKNECGSGRGRGRGVDVVLNAEDATLNVKEVTVTGDGVNDNDDDEDVHVVYVKKIPMEEEEEENEEDTATTSTATAAVLSPVHHNMWNRSTSTTRITSIHTYYTHDLAIIILGHIIILTMMGLAIYIHMIAFQKLDIEGDGSSGGGGICDRNTYFPDEWYDKYPLQYYREYAYFKFFSHCQLGQEGVYSLNGKNWTIVAFVCGLMSLCTHVVVECVSVRRANKARRARIITSEGGSGSGSVLKLDKNKDETMTVASDNNAVMDQFPLEVERAECICEKKNSSRSIMVGIMAKTTATTKTMKDDVKYSKV